MIKNEALIRMKNAEQNKKVDNSKKVPKNWVEINIKNCLKEYLKN